jgi:hypothetical protein
LSTAADSDRAEGVLVEDVECDMVVFFSFRSDRGARARVGFLRDAVSGTMMPSARAGDRLGLLRGGDAARPGQVGGAHLGAAHDRDRLLLGGAVGGDRSNRMPAGRCAPSCRRGVERLEVLVGLLDADGDREGIAGAKSVAPSAMTNLIWLLKVAPTATRPISTPSGSNTAKVPPLAAPMQTAR